MKNQILTNSRLDPNNSRALWHINLLIEVVRLPVSANEQISWRGGYRGQNINCDTSGIQLSYTLIHAQDPTASKKGVLS